MALQSNSGSATSAASLAVAFTSNVGAGNLIFILSTTLFSGDAPNVTDSQGNSYTFWNRQFTIGGGEVDLWYAIAGSSGACTVTLTLGSPPDTMRMIIAEYAKSGTPTVDQLHTTNANTGTSFNTGNITTTVANEVLLAFAWDRTRDGSPWTDSQSFTNVKTTVTGESLTLWEKGVSSTGTYNDVLTATNGISGDDVAMGIGSFSGITASAALIATCGSPPTAYQNSSYTSTTFGASGGTSPYTFSISAGALPPGLAINSSTGAVTGTPTTAGVFAFTLHVVDSASATANASCSITVVAASAAPFLALTQHSITRLQAMFDNTKAIDNLQLVNINGILYYISKQQYPFNTANELVTAYFSDFSGLTWSVGATVATGPNSPGSGSSTGFSMCAIGTKIYVCDAQLPLDGGGGLNHTLGIWTYNTVTNTWAGPSAGGPFVADAQVGATSIVPLNGGNILVFYIQTSDSFVTDKTLSCVVYNVLAGTWGTPTVLANYGHAAGSLNARPLAILHDPNSDNTVLYFNPGSVNSTANLTLQAMVVSSVGTLLNTPSALYTAVSVFAINGEMGVPCLTSDSPYSAPTVAFPFRDFNSGATLGNIVIAYVNPATNAQTTETAAFMTDFNSPNIIAVYTQQNQGGWCCFDFGGNLYLTFTVNNGNLNSASSQNFLYAKSRGGSTTWSGLQLIYTSAVSREGLQPFKAAWNSAGPAIVTNNWDPTNNDQSGTVAGLTSFILLPSVLSLTCGNPPPGVLNVSYSAQPVLTGGTAPFVWTISAGALPPGLTMNGSTGAISGIPTATGADPFYSFTITVTDNVSNTVSVNCRIPVFAALGKRTELFIWQIQALPEQVFDWRSQFISHGKKGYHHIGAIMAAYVATAPVTLSFQVKDGTAPASITLPSTGGNYSRIWLNPTFNKAILYRYIGHSTDPFQFVLPDWITYVKEWTEPGPYEAYRLIGEG